MFCPNCGSNITLAQKFCRGCGLKLEKIAEELALQLPTQTHSDLLRRALLLEKIGVVTLVVFGSIIVFGVIFMAIYGVNMKPFGIIPGILIFIMFACGLLSVFFFNYATHLREKVNSPGFDNAVNELERQKHPTLLEEKPLDYIPASVTENTTELLRAEKSKTTNELR
jgi:uncharacterized membrane protein YvbJ